MFLRSIEIDPINNYFVFDEMSPIKQNTESLKAEKDTKEFIHKETVKEKSAKILQSKRPKDTDNGNKQNVQNIKNCEKLIVNTTLQKRITTQKKKHQSEFNNKCNRDNRLSDNKVTKTSVIKEIIVQDAQTWDQMIVDPEIEVVYEGELKKYHPGLRCEFIPRWCQVTAKQFMYFNKRMSLSSWLRKPLLMVPLKQIKMVRYIPKNENRSKQLKYNSMYEFEILLKENAKIFQQKTKRISSQNDITYNNLRSSRKNKDYIGDNKESDKSKQKRSRKSCTIVFT